MKLCLLLSLFCMALLARSQNSPELDGSAWLLAQPTFSNYNDACWPSNLITISSNATGLIFSADAWNGYGCGMYGLYYQGFSFYVANGSEFGSINLQNHTIQFYYQLLNSSTLMIIFGFECANNTNNCTESVDVYYTNATVSSCDFDIMSVPFNTCPIGANNTTFNVSTTLGTITLSVGGNNVLNCAGTEYIWAVLHGGFAGCFDVATESPFATFLYSTAPLNGGLNLTFPVQLLPNSSIGAGFQLNIDLSCLQTDYSTSSTTFALNGMSTNASTGLTTINVWGWSGYSCVQSNNSCPSVIQGNTVYTFDACMLNQTSYSVSDPLGGVLTFNFGTTPAMKNCASYSNTHTVYGIYQVNDGVCLSAAESYISYALLNKTNSSQGILLTFGRGLNWGNANVDLQVSLLCNSEQVEDIQLDPIMSVTYEPTTGGPLLQVTGSSPHACPVSSANYSIW